MPPRGLRTLPAYMKPKPGYLYPDVALVLNCTPKP